MKLFGTSLWRALTILAALFVFSSAQAQQPCGISVSPTGEILFESVQGAVVYKVLTVTNTSSAGLEVHAFMTGEDSSAFSFEPRSFELAAGATKELKVAFKPNLSNVIRYAAVMNFTVNSGVVCTQVEMIGTGTFIGTDKGLISDPGSYKYPSVDLGHQACKTFVIVNKTAATATISEISIEGDESFVLPQTLTFPITIEPNGTFSLEVCYAPDQQEDLYVDGKVVVEYTTANSSEDRKLYISLVAGANTGGDQVVVIVPAQYKFPSVAVGETVCKEFMVVNKSAMKATITSVTFEGNDVFTVTSLTSLPVDINIGDSLLVKVCYTPTSLDDAKGSLSVNYTFDGGITVKHAYASFYAIHEKPACLVSGPGDDWKEPILLGGKDDRQFVVVNTTASTITINEIRLAGEDVAAFTINATAPITLNAGDTAFIPFTFAPYAGQNGYIKEKYIAAIVLSFTSDPAIDCREHEDHLWGYALRDHKDDDSASVAISLFPNEKQTIGLSNRGIKESYTLLFKNNLDRDVVVKSISLADGTKFKIAATDPATTPFTLKPSETFTVTIEFESADGLLYKDKLVIVSDFAATAIEFDLQGINAEKALKVWTMPEGVQVAVMPNPMHSSTTVDLEGVRSASIEVSDVLGATVVSTVTTGDWKWNGRMSNGAIAPAGTYFVRIQGESTNGERFVTTQRVVVER